MRRHSLLPFTLLVLVLNVVAEAGQAPAPAPAQDPSGDPLPEGAVARVGQDRWLHGITATFAAFLPDGKRVISINSDRSIRIWEFPTGKELSRAFLFEGDAKLPVGAFGGGPFFGGTPIAMTRDGKTLAYTPASTPFVASGEGEIVIHEVGAAKPLPQRIKLPVAKDAPMPRGRLRVAAIAFSPNGEQLATLTGNGKLTLWNWTNDKELWSKDIGVQENRFGDLRLAFAPDGKFVATGQALDRPMENDLIEIKLWECASGKLLQTIRADADLDGIQLSLAVSPDSKTVAFTTGSSIMLAETGTGKEIGKLNPTKDAAGAMPGFLEVSSVIFSNDGSKLYAAGNGLYAAGNGDRGIMEWDLATRKLVRRSVGVPGDTNPFLANGEISLSPDGKMLVKSGRGPQCYDLTGKDITPINRITLPLLSVQFLPDGKSLVTGTTAQSVAFGGPGFGGLQATGLMEKWDAATGKNLGKVTLPPATVNGGLSPNGKVIAGFQFNRKVGPGTEPKVVLLDAADSKEISQVALQEPEVAVSFCFTPDGKSVAIAQPKKQRLELYDVATAKLVRTFDAVPGAGNTGKGVGRFGALRSMVFSADGKVLAWCEAPNMATVVLLETATGNKIGAFPLPPNLVNPKAKGGGGGFGGGLAGLMVMDRAVSSPDSRCIALEMFDGTTALYELASGRPRCTFGEKKAAPKDDVKGGIAAQLAAATGGRTCFAFSPDGKLFAQSGPDGIIHLWDTLTRKQIAQFKGHAEGVNAVAFAPDGKTLASASADSTALIWDLSKLGRPLAAQALKDADLEACWAALAGDDAAEAYARMADLVAAPAEAVVFLKGRLKPAAAIDLKHVEELIGQLDANQFKVRNKAKTTLQKMDEQVLPTLAKALAANPPLEPKRILEQLRAQLASVVLQGDRLRAHRAVEVLELIGTPQSRELLEVLANGAPAALLTTSARTALKRF
jgi:WD40 repeat protein